MGNKIFLKIFLSVEIQKSPRDLQTQSFTGSMHLYISNKFYFINK